MRAEQNWLVAFALAKARPKSARATSISFSWALMLAFQWPAARASGLASNQQLAS